MELLRVILIEDDLMQCELLGEFLERSHEIRCDFIHTDRLQAGIGILRDALTKPEDIVVILDLGLPDGEAMRLQAVSMIRAVSEKPAIIVLSGDISFLEARQAIRMGADGVRQKPPENPERFVWSVLEVMERRRDKLLALDLQADNFKPTERPKLLDKKSKIAIITAAIVGAIGTFIAGFWEFIKNFFSRH
jgi:DNA-binding NarL/FixJ family response regulator